jgi:hypothetical protein
MILWPSWDLKSFAAAFSYLEAFLRPTRSQKSTANSRRWGRYLQLVMKFVIGPEPRLLKITIGYSAQFLMTPHDTLPLLDRAWGRVQQS